ncbi:Vibriobactin utilization protein ViuB [Vibrio thalassae]|uniref:Vibriobactin utilization protein ViuB n=1 Tax=Vibrio thalassae TaxID=1243014 RepID=A0A240EKV1_9VIBR|nr:siderophore-interacting protein [Vibrio thalassae]SNX48625.1 Vibriobactin utilization protein ViuB [Vibrio thalassae]
MNKPSPKTLKVTHVNQLSPNMLRISFNSKDLKTFPADSVGGYIKLLFNEHGGTDITGLSAENRPKMRTYTIRNLDIQLGQMDVDFVTHITEDKLCGFGARWASSATVGDMISIMGPGTVQEVDPTKDWFFFNADMTSLPALAVKLKLLPRDAKGYAVIQIEDNADEQTLEAPKGIRVIWTTESLSKTSEDLEWLAGVPFVWCACEFDEMRALRRYFRNDKEIPRQDIYISSYWKRGVAEDGHKVIKKQDHEEFEAN